MTQLDPQGPRHARNASTSPPQGRPRFLAWVGAGTFALILVVVIGILITHSTTWTAAEMGILEAISRSHTPALDAAALGVSYLFSPKIAAIILVVVTLIILLVTKKATVAVQFIVVVAGSWLGSELIKAIVERTRPDHSLLAHSLSIESSSSFPSGHTAFAASLAMGLIMLAWKGRWRGWVVAAGVLGVVAVAYSRVYLGVHYVSDVMASIVYSAVAVTLLTLLWNRFLTPHFRSTK